MSKFVSLKPILNEKAVNLSANLNQYTFAVDGNTNKVEIAKEVEKRFKVKVTKVTSINLRGKAIRFGKRRESHYRKNRYKAIVSLKKGDKIDLFEVK